jgi:hypothetical protein
MRSLYRYLLRCHPQPFRDRFEEEMLLIYGDATSGRRKIWLLFDVLLSLFRQWALRPHRRPDAAGRATIAPAGVPAFAMIENVRPRPAALFLGSLVSLFMFSAVLTTSYISTGASSLPFGIVGIRWSFGWDLADSQSLETPARQRLNQWLDAYNTGDIRAMQRFASQYVENFPRHPGTNDPNVNAWTNLFQRYGPLKLHTTHQTQNDRIIGVARANNGDWWWIRLHISTAESYPVLAVAAENLANAVTPPKE